MASRPAVTIAQTRSLHSKREDRRSAFPMASDGRIALCGDSGFAFEFGQLGQLALDPRQFLQQPIADQGLFCLVEQQLGSGEASIESRELGAAEIDSRQRGAGAGQAPRWLCVGRSHHRWRAHPAVAIGARRSRFRPLSALERLPDTAPWRAQSRPHLRRSPRA